jgi:predicted chitinase
MESAVLTKGLMSVSVDDLRAICPRLTADRAQALLVPLTSCLLDYQITTVGRLAAFLAQLAVESGEFRWVEEIWGPSSQQQKYEPPSELAKKLGNSQEGDGHRFRGRGFIQITGRYNYLKYGNRLGIDLIALPQRAKETDIAFRIAGLYWVDHGLNEKADAGDLKAITRAINGGLNKHTSRLTYYRKALEVLGSTTA